MKIPRKAIHVMIGVEVIVLIIVAIVSVLHPFEKVVTKYEGPKHEQNIEVVSTQTEETEAESEPEVTELTISDAVREKVMSMSLEEKVAQMFVTTPEALTGMRQVTATGNTTKTAISNYPVGGVVYSALNFAGHIQTASMTETLQTYYVEQFGMPLFLMVEEFGGSNASPLASGNGFEVEKSPLEIGTENNAENAVIKANNIATYMLSQGLNTTMGICADLTSEIESDYNAQTFSADAITASNMVDSTVKAYKEAGVFTAVSMFPGESNGLFMEREFLEWEQQEGLAYEAAIAAGTDMIIVGNAYANCFTSEEEIPCCMSPEVVTYLRYDMNYQGILLTDALDEEHLLEKYTVGEAAVQAINAGIDMVYCPSDFKEAYQAVLDAVTDGTIHEELINEAVMRILTYKNYE